MVNGLGVGNREREESSICFLISELNSGVDGVLFSQEKEIGWRISSDEGVRKPELSFRYVLCTVPTKYPGRNLR